MKKRIISVILALCLVIGAAMPAFAAKKDTLRFDENGEFKILHLCDCQDGYPAKENMLKYINYMLKTYEPDLVVLGGDNCVCAKEDKPDAIKELVAPFVENKVYFTLVFGNHDHEQGVDKETLLKYYQKFGGKYCLAYDAVPEMSGTATHNLPVYASDGSGVKFNVWMFDSGSYVYDENGNRLGYDSVRKDQIEWYESTSKALEAKAGEKVPSLAFQHIIVKEIYDVMFPKALFKIPFVTETYDGTTYSVFNPDTSSFIGFMLEPPSPGVFNHGQFDAMVERGDVLGLLVGHDHINSYEAELDGIKLINTPGVSMNAYGNEFVRGSRLITIKEDDPWNFTSEVITVNDVAAADPDFAASIGRSSAEAKAWIALGDFHIFLKMLSKAFAWLIY